MGEKEPNIRIYTDTDIQTAMTELKDIGISPIMENIAAYLTLKETKQRPQGYEEIYNNLNNPENLKELMQKKNIQSLIHIEGPTVWDHTKLAMKTLDQEKCSPEEKKLLQQIVFHHDLGKYEATRKHINTIQTIKTIASGKLFQTMAGHATEAGTQIERGLKANGLTAEETKFCLNIIENHMATDILQRKNPKKIVEFFKRFGEQEEDMKKGIAYLARMLRIDGVSTINAKLHDGNIHYSPNNKKTDFRFNEVRDKYIQAKKELVIQEKQDETIKEMMHDCDVYLPIIAEIIIPDNEENTAFRNNLDDPEEHQPQRHEFGIITHTKKALEHFFNRDKRIKPIKEQIDGVLHETIDGKTKEELMAISIIYHDIGKFLRSVTIKDGTRILKHTDHEAIGKDIILTNDKIHTMIQKHYDLTENQIHYITDCIGLHYELSKMRDAMKKTNQEYGLRYVASETFKSECEKIIDNNPEYTTEIGIYYLCDSLAKTDITSYGRTDEELLNSKETVKKRLEEKKMTPKLLEAAMQRPVNVGVAKKYLEYLFPLKKTD